MKLITEEGRKSYQHTPEELRSILTATLVLGIAFTIALFDMPMIGDGLAPALVFCSAMVLFGLLAKELAQKGTARTFESYVTYENWTPGIILSLLTSLFGVVFAAVGGMRMATEYTERHGRWRIELNPQHMGIVSSIGPMMSLAVAMAFLMLSPLAPSILIERNIFIVAAQINAYIALFSMVPIDPLDGAKILRWSTALWTFVVGMSLVVLMLSIGWI